MNFASNPAYTDINIITINCIITATIVVVLVAFIKHNIDIAIEIITEIIANNLNNPPLAPTNVIPPKINIIKGIIVLPIIFHT